MSTGRSRTILTLILVLLFSAGALADKKQTRKRKFDFKGPMGFVMKVFGSGKDMYQVEYVKGNLYRNDTMDKKGKKVERSQIVNLDEGLIINIDHKKKKYTQMTFEEWRQKIEEGFGQIFNQPEYEVPDSLKDHEQPQPEVKWNVKVDIQTPGDTKKFADRESEKVIVELTVEAEATTANPEGEEVEATGGMKVTATNWMAKGVDNEEFLEFHRKFVEEIGMEIKQSQIQDMTKKIHETNPQLAAAMDEFEDQSDALEGVAMKSTTVFASWGAAKKDEENGAGIPTSLGGFAKRFKKDDNKPKDILEMESEIKEHDDSALETTIFEVPAGYELEENK